MASEKIQHDTLDVVFMLVEEACHTWWRFPSTIGSTSPHSLLTSVSVIFSNATLTSIQGMAMFFCLFVLGIFIYNFTISSASPSASDHCHMYILISRDLYFQTVTWTSVHFFVNIYPHLIPCM